MPLSTANFISYDLRPAKQSERRILVDLLKIGGDCGLPIDIYRYVGMGANRFYDFLLLHKYLSISNMISLEHDEDMFKRAEFNVPFGFIDVQQKSTAEFIGQDAAEAPSIYWLDYDGGIGSEILGDIASFSTKLKLGDYCFVTTAGGMPKFLVELKASGRLAWLQENFGDIAGDVDSFDVERSSFHNAVHKLLMTAFTNAFSPRSDGIFVPLLQVSYSDSTLMVTVGGAFLAADVATGYREKVNRILPFLDVETPTMYRIPSLHLTERERALFDRAVTSTGPDTAEEQKLRAIGFDDDALSSYKDMLRYAPRYVETIV